ncbi:MAG: hypothetical protein WA824_16090 [Candidatus Sulfotelmatobacter sp.]
MKPQKRAPAGHSEIESVRLVWLAAFVSVFSVLYYQRHGEILLSGDAVAHINIARRVFDSKTPGLLQLGTVWLPLPHLLMLPFIVPIRLWQSGTGGSIPSMAAYILSVLGIFRFVRTVLARDGKEIDSTGKVTAWAAAILYAANPNLIYMQATAMTEPLYLAFFIWALVYFAEFAGSIKADRSLSKSGLCVAGACLTRYDGWFLAGILIFAAAIIYFARRTSGESLLHSAKPQRRELMKFILIASAAPVLWLAYNAAVYRNPLEFANGPYSAKAIEQKTATVNPAKGNVYAAASYFLKAAELNIGEAKWQQRLWLILAVAGIAIVIFAGPRIALLLWIPLPFYALSVAYGSIPIFVPTWWPFSMYNVRYGLELLPAFAVFVPLAISFLVRSAAKLPQVELSSQMGQGAATFIIAIGLAAVNYTFIWRDDPICYREAYNNNRGRIALDAQLAKWVTSFPPDSTFLMYLGEHSRVFEQAGIPLRRVINEGNQRVWIRPYDPQGLWERALADPTAYANCIIGFEGDPVWAAAKAHHLTALVEIHTTSQPPAAIFEGAKPQSTQHGATR